MTSPIAADHDLVATATSRARGLTEPLLRAIVDSLGPTLAGIGHYHFGWQPGTELAAGKAVRPTLAVLAAEAVGAAPSAALPAAAAAELVHNFSLIHDDIIDSDEQRRGRPSVWKAHGVAAAILIGDALHSAAFELLLGTGSPHAAAVAERLAVAMREVVIGQVQDIEFTGRPWSGAQAVTVAEYQAMAEAKTGALLAFSAAGGAQLAGASPEAVRAFDALGRHLGLAFQCTDDVLGIWGDPLVTGKPVFGDLREGKKTLPMIAALSSGTPAGNRLRELLPAGDAEPELVAALVEEAGGRQYAEQEAARQLRGVAQQLDALPMPEQVRRSFKALAGTLIGRTR
ncbi:dimethylallyltransferase [Saccharopolyspora subtropica]|uniref:Dimethylallyltransferase n=1 Tax=Saccharopolyspora thermophila TaxID=89367 RepID=A0A917JWE8_9PSEU|nr:polyprenyl synthetase family protein [Saccharopolyspora subtropica]GGI87793.1 dimethylallyltransferase [Saccharopolyspora subtropica]